MARLLEGDVQTYERCLITQVCVSHWKSIMWSGSIIRDYYETNVILDKSIFCLVNLRCQVKG